MSEPTNSAAEMVALALLEKIAGTELWVSGAHWRAPGVDRAKILDTYAECLAVVKGYRKKTPMVGPG